MKTRPGSAVVEGIKEVFGDVPRHPQGKSYFFRPTWKQRVGFAAGTVADLWKEPGLIRSYLRSTGEYLGWQATDFVKTRLPVIADEVEGIVIDVALHVTQFFGRMP